MTGWRSPRFDDSQSRSRFAFSRRVSSDREARRVEFGRKTDTIGEDMRLPSVGPGARMHGSGSALTRPDPKQPQTETPDAMGDSRITVPKFTALKASGQKITVLTAYDFAMARLIDGAGVEGILVGDTLSMVVQGHSTTLPVTLDEMIYHAEIVGRAVEHALVVVDMPFPSYHLGAYKAVENAGRILKETGCQAVKLEGGVDQAETIRALVTAGIPVMAHVGLRRKACINLAVIRFSATRNNCSSMPRPLRIPVPSRSCWSAFQQPSPPRSPAM